MTGVKADVIRTFGTVFEDVSCEQVASKTLRAAFTWGGVAALFVDEAGNAPGADGFRALTFCGLRRSRWISRWRLN